MPGQRADGHAAQPFTIGKLALLYTEAVILGRDRRWSRDLLHRGLHSGELRLHVGGDARFAVDRTLSFDQRCGERGSDQRQRTSAGLDSLAGKLLRVTPTGKRPVEPRSDRDGQGQPLEGLGTRGLRNPFRQLLPGQACPGSGVGWDR